MNLFYCLVTKSLINNLWIEKKKRKRKKGKRKDHEKNKGSPYSLERFSILTLIALTWRWMDSKFLSSLFPKIWGTKMKGFVYIVISFYFSFIYLFNVFLSKENLNLHWPVTLKPPNVRFFSLLFVFIFICKNIVLF